MVLSPPFFSPLSSFLFFPPFISTFTYGTSSLHAEVAWMDVVQHRQMGQKELLVQQIEKGGNGNNFVSKNFAAFAFLRRSNVKGCLGQLVKGFFSFDDVFSFSMTFADRCRLCFAEREGEKYTGENLQHKGKHVFCYLPYII